MESVPAPEAPKKNQTPLIIAVVVIVLCCLCVILGVAGYFGYITLQSSEAPVDFSEDVEITPDDSQVPTFEPFDSLGEAPTGGLGNDILRNDTWAYVASASIGQGCDQPLGADSTIEVLQEPENGVWVEKWTVACSSGESYSYEVEYILDDTGTTFNIKSLP